MPDSSGRTTSASNVNVVVSDQLRTVALMGRPPFEKPSDSTFVNGQGPAMQERRAFRNSFSAPASRETPLAVAFHFPSGEHRGARSHGTFPVLTTSNVLTPLPTVVATFASTVYLTERSLISTCGWGWRGRASARAGVRRATKSSSPAE